MKRNLTTVLWYNHLPEDYKNFQEMNKFQIKLKHIMINNPLYSLNDFSHKDMCFT